MTSTCSRVIEIILLVNTALLFSQTASAHVPPFPLSQKASVQNVDQKPDWWIRGALAALDDADPEVVHIALHKIADNNAGGEIPDSKVSIIDELLSKNDPEDQELGCRLLGQRRHANIPQTQKLQELLHDKAGSRTIRLAAARALGEMEESTKHLKPIFAELLSDDDPEIREGAAVVLAGLGEAAIELAPKLAEMLNDSNEAVRIDAARALGEMGDAAAAQAPSLEKLLHGASDRVRIEAAEALGKMGDAGKTYAPILEKMLDDSNVEVRIVAFGTLAKMGQTTKPQKKKKIFGWLYNAGASVQADAARALGNLGEAAKDLTPILARFLADADPNVQRAALEALGKLGEVAASQTPEVATLLRNPNPEFRIAAAEVLGEIGESAANQVPEIAGLLSDASPEARIAAMKTLGKMGEAAKELAPKLMEMLLEDEGILRLAALEALENMGPFPLEDIFPIIEMTYRDSGNRARYLCAAHISAGGDNDIETVLRWLGRQVDYPYPQIESAKDIKTLLAFFASLWPLTEKFPSIRQDVATQTNRLVADTMKKDGFDKEDTELLRNLEKILLPTWESHLSGTDTVPEIIQSINNQQQTSEIFFAVLGAFLIHFFFWCILVILYPRSYMIQSIFFWNRWVRSIFGLGYIGILLAAVPLIRRRLLFPFSTLLLADASLDRFISAAYFKDSEALLIESDSIGTSFSVPLESALRSREDRPLILRGESGLGKTMLLRYRISTTNRLAVFLPAVRCTDGVIEAIVSKLEGRIRDFRFLKTLIHSDDLYIYIDGLNEVKPDTRSRIARFAEKRVNVIIATQPLDWEPPSNTIVLELLPLTREQIKQFLYTRWDSVKNKTNLSAEAYLAACDEYLTNVLGDAQSEKKSSESRWRIENTLSNPMDLTLVSEMIASGKDPDMTNLLSYYYEKVAADYRRVHLSDFPLGRFSKHVLKRRLTDYADIGDINFSDVLRHMEKHRMVIRREADSGTTWYFRNENISDFFAAQQFLGADNPNVKKFMGDPRFRGVYYLLAHLMTPEEATALRQLNGEIKEDEAERYLRELNSRRRVGFEHNRERGLRVESVTLEEVPFFGSLEWRFKPRINVLLGRNGYGKSHLLRLVAALLSRESAVVCRFLGSGGGQASLEMADPSDTDNAFTITRTSESWKDDVGKVPVLAIGDMRFIDRARETFERPSLENEEAFPEGGAFHFVHRRVSSNLIENNLFLLCLDFTSTDTSRSIKEDLAGLIHNVIHKLADTQFEIADIRRPNRHEQKFEILVNTEGTPEPVPLQVASQGTLSVLSIVLHIYYYLVSLYPKVEDSKALIRKRGIVIIDEIDAHLHPAWQRKIVSVLRDAFPNMQFIFSAHSPLVVAGCREGEVSTLRFDGERGVRLHSFQHDFIGWDPAEILREVQEVEPQDIEYLKLRSDALKRSGMEKEIDALENKQDLSPDEEARLNALEERILDIETAEKRAAERLDMDAMRTRIAELERELRALKDERKPT